MRYVELPLTELVAKDLLPLLEAWLANGEYSALGRGGAGGG